MIKNHTNKDYENELKTLEDMVLLISARALKMVENSIKALSNNDISLAEKTIADDRYIDRDELNIDKLCIEILARRQPLGQDLRFVVSILKMVTYFERIGDISVKICQGVIKLKRLENHYSTDGIEEMSRLVQLMLKETHSAFISKDHKKAELIIKQDQKVDQVYHQTMSNYINEMQQSNEDVECHHQLLSIAKWLERVGDHCTNLAELIIFMVKGQDVRHPGAAIKNETLV